MALIRTPAWGCDRPHSRLQASEGGGPDATERGDLKRSGAILLSLFASTPVAAEGCDTVGRGGSSADGPVHQLGGPAPFFGAASGLIVPAMLLAAVLLPTIWFTAMVATLRIAIVALDISTRVEADPAANAAIKEGCETAPAPTTIALIARAARIAAMTRRGSRTRKAGA